MPCSLLSRVFDRATTGLVLHVNFSVHAFDAARRSSFAPATIFGSGPLPFIPAPPHFVGPASFEGVVPCNIVWSDSSRPAASENITVRIGATPHAPESISVSLVANAGSAIAINGSFPPQNCNAFGSGTEGSLTGFVDSFPVAMMLSLA